MKTKNHALTRFYLLPALALAVLGGAQNVRAQILDQNQFAINPNVYEDASGTPPVTNAIPDYAVTFNPATPYASNSYYGNFYDNTVGYGAYLQDAEMSTVASALGSITAGDEYDVTFSFQLKSNKDTSLGTESGVGVQWYNASKVLLSTTDLVDYSLATAPASWTAQSFDAVAPTGAAYAGIQWYSQEETDASTFQLTDLGATPEPSTWAMLFSSLFALLFVKRLVRKTSF